ncbi:YbgC/FadM family acyl-CoA thioesterase [Rhodopila sp.]|uniref:YbgC/FadM family acyl-CoA thioesterase n=1 Tax=Rhodopila sp. TaxID=2480087 RepID=UPI003D0ECBAE
MIAHRQSSHRYSLRVYYEDTDAGGVVYHANYLRYAERARTEALRDAGIPHAELVERFGLLFMVYRAEIDYPRPALVDDVLVVDTETMDVGGATVLLRQTILGPNGVCATLRIRLACVRIGGNKPARIPAEWRAAMATISRDPGVATRGPRRGSATGVRDSRPATGAAICHVRRIDSAGP